MPFIELSHRITAGMTTYPGLPGPRIGDHISRAQAAERFGKVLDEVLAFERAASAR